MLTTFQVHNIVTSQLYRSIHSPHWWQ